MKSTIFVHLEQIVPDIKCDADADYTSERAQSLFRTMICYLLGSPQGLRFSLASVFLVSTSLEIECFEECNPPDCTPIFYK